MTKAVYAFSGDPITYGHIDIVERAAKIYENLIVAIGQNPEKKYTFSIEERLEMAKKTLSHLQNVEVVSFTGLLVDFAYENDISLIIRGVRNNEDLNYEKLLFDMNSLQHQGIDTTFLIANQKYSQISSTTVKDMIKDNAFIHDLVPLYVKQKLESKLNKQHFLSITGEIGSGKSYVANKFVEFGTARQLEVHNIELDEIGHRILGELTEQLYVNVRNRIVEKFGNEVKMENGMIDRKILGGIVFNDEEKLSELNEIMLKPILTRLRQEIKGKEGLIILSAALTAESEISFLSNNNVLLIESNRELQKSRLKLKGYTDDQIERRINSQFDSSRKLDLLKNQALKFNYGKVWQFENNDATDDEIRNIFNEISSTLIPNN